MTVLGLKILIRHGCVNPSQGTFDSACRFVTLGDGRGCCRLLQQGPSLPAYSPCQFPIPLMLTASLLCSATSSLTPPSHLLLPPAWRSVCVRERRAAGALVALGPRGLSQKGVWKKNRCNSMAAYAGWATVTVTV